MRVALHLAFFLFGTSCITAQNLVPNPSFEAYSQCPDALGEIDRVEDWSGLYVTPDYFNECSDTVATDVPGNGFGYQEAADGQAYVGCYTYRSGLIIREHLQAQLSEALVAGQPVFLSMKVAVGGFGIGENLDMQFTCKGIGMRFSTEQLNPGLTITNMAALFLDQPLQDTSNWISIGAIYVPDSAYEFIQVGNFFDDEMSDASTLDPAGNIEGAYAFVDDLCVSSVSGICDLPTFLVDHGKAIRSTTGSFFSAFLDLEIPAEVGQCSVTLWDAFGRECWKSLAPAGIVRYRIPTSQLSLGTYLVRVHSAFGVTHSLRVFHVEN